jgi:hypothetical protein
VVPDIVRNRRETGRSARPACIGIEFDANHSSAQVSRRDVEATRAGEEIDNLSVLHRYPVSISSHGGQGTDLRLHAVQGPHPYHPI